MDNKEFSKHLKTLADNVKLPRSPELVASTVLLNIAKNQLLDTFTDEQKELYEKYLEAKKIYEQALENDKLNKK